MNAARRDDVAANQVRLSLGCDVHRGATVSTRCFDLCKDDVSGLLALAITERGTGRFSLLKSILVDVCLRRLRIVGGGRFGKSGDEAFDHRQALLDVALPLTD